ncbi:BMP-binding endothelial regulator protein-like [Saccoglossus kowalevskii]
MKGTIIVKKCGITNRDPHMITFDGVKYEFQGPCTYVLTQDCDNVSKPTFQITADFRGKYSVLKSKYLTRIDAVNININGTQVVRILKNNDILVTVKIIDSHPSIKLNKIGMSLQWLKESSAVEIAFNGQSIHGRNVCGLMGNNNDNPADDLMKPDGTIVTDVYEFGNSWVVPGSCP